MSNLPIVMQEAGANPPVLSSELQAAYNVLADTMLLGFQGGFNRIKVGKMDFTLVENGTARRVPNGEVMGVCLGVNPVDYCSWYEKTYEPTQEPEQPDLVWLWPDHEQFPAALPERFRQKKNRNGQDKWDFRIARRSVWALIQPDMATGQYFLNLDAPYAFDITSASLYGKSDLQMNWHKWAGLIQMCNRFSQPPNFICSPAMFLTRLRIDPTSTVSGVVYFEPLLTEDRRSLMYLDSATFTGVVEAMRSQTVQDMLQIKEILEWPKNTAQSSVQETSPQAGPSAQTVAPMQPTTPPQEPVHTSPTPTVQPSVEQDTVPPMQAATSIVEEPRTVDATQDSAMQSRLAQAQALLNNGAVPSNSATGTPHAEHGEPTHSPSGAAPTNVNPTTAAAIQAFGDAL